MQTKLIAEQQNNIYSQLYKLSGYIENLQYAEFIEESKILYNLLQNFGINTSAMTFSDIQNIAKLLVDFYTNSYTVKVLTDSIELYEQQNETLQYLLRPNYGNSLWLYQYIPKNNSFLHLLHIEQWLEQVDNQDKLIHMIKTELHRETCSLIKNITHKTEWRATELYAEAEKRDQLRHKNLLFSQKVKKVIIALLLLPVRFVVSEKYVREHPIFHFTFPEI